MTTDTADKIMQFISSRGQASGKEITDYLGTISDRGVRKQLKKFSDSGVFKKIGRPPKVYYSLITSQQENKLISVDLRKSKIINDNYLYITPTGESKSGWDGFLSWCTKTNQNPEQTACEYVKTLAKYDKFKMHGLINGMLELKSTFKNVWLDKLFYLDFYSIERFGKTKMGQMLLYAKQSQNKALINQLVEDISPRINQIIEKYHIDGVLFIPPTVKRDVQLMKVMEQKLRLPVRLLSVTKVKTEIAVPQKTLSKLEDRIENAKHTIIVDDVKRYQNIMLIDDAVGSGATLNETAKQIRHRNLVSGKIIGLAITGSFKGFDIISEV